MNPGRLAATAALVTVLSLASGRGLIPLAAAQDDLGGLPPGKGQETTFYACTPCHSMRIVVQQRLTRSVWDDVLTWMVDEKGMPPMDPPDRAQVLDYLTEKFNPSVPRDLSR